MVRQSIGYRDITDQTITGMTGGTARKDDYRYIYRDGFRNGYEDSYRAAGYWRERD